MLKMKIYRGVKKRIKVIGIGKFVIKYFGKSYILIKKDRKRKNYLKKDVVVIEIYKRYM